MMKLEKILVADWGKEGDKRVAYQIDVPRRLISYLAPPKLGWTIEGLVDLASTISDSTLVLIDVAIGLPFGLFEAMRAEVDENKVGHLLALLRARPAGELLGEARRPEDWSVRKPYIHVPKGDGSLTAFRAAAEHHCVQLRRAIDLETGGRSPLILSGIPGTVGYGSRDLLERLGKLDAKHVAVWPFDGPLNALLETKRVILGEIYPRALYGHVLSDKSNDERARIAIGKGTAAIRAAAVVELELSAWHKHLEVPLHPDLLERARVSEDDFDAYFSAIGILRLLLEKVGLEDGSLRSRLHGDRPVLDDIAEGGMLGITAAQLELRQQAFKISVANSESVNVSSSKMSGGQRISKPPYVSITTQILDNVKKYQNSRQIALGQLRGGTKQAPLWMRILCEGIEYTLTSKDTTGFWASHQTFTREDFDALYRFLSDKPDQRIEVSLIEVSPLCPAPLVVARDIAKA